jgi:hypothetical protein
MPALSRNIPYTKSPGQKIRSGFFLKKNRDFFSMRKPGRKNFPEKLF